MRLFAELVLALDRATSPAGKVAALGRYFHAAPPADAAWGLWLLTGRRVKRAVTTAELRPWAAEAAGLPNWLVEECIQQVGDVSEALALLLPDPGADAGVPTSALPLAHLIEHRLLPLTGASEADRKAGVQTTWNQLDTPERILWHRLLTGTFRPGLSSSLLAQALAGLAGVPATVMTARLAGEWNPGAGDLARLLSGLTAADNATLPHPFHLAGSWGVRPPTGADRPTAGEPAAAQAAALANTLGPVDGWICEWKWDAPRAQLLRREGRTVIWSRRGEMLTDSFPALTAAARALPEGAVLDGMLLPSAAGASSPAERRPEFLAFDLLEADGVDRRPEPLSARRGLLEELLAASADQFRQTQACEQPPRWTQADLFGAAESSAATATVLAPWPIRLSPLLEVSTWADVVLMHEQARSAGAGGVMLKRRDSRYAAGRPEGAWWKWDAAPLTCHAVLVAAQPAPAGQPGAFAEYTFAVWRGLELVPVARAHAGLSEEQTEKLNSFVRKNTTGKFGPVRAVNPLLVFELAFAGIEPSTRHKSGLALRDPRIARAIPEKQPAEADSLEAVQALQTVLRRAGG